MCFCRDRNIRLNFQSLWKEYGSDGSMDTKGIEVYQLPTILALYSTKVLITNQLK